MVMEEMPVPRKTHVLLRGQYDKPGDLVQPGVPAVFPPLPAGGVSNRLDFAPVSYTHLTLPTNREV